MDWVGQKGMDESSFFYHDCAVAGTICAMRRDAMHWVGIGNFLFSHLYSYTSIGFGFGEG